MVDFSKIIRLINAGNGPVFSHFNDHGKLCMEILYVNFFRVVGSEFVQKYLGEGPRMVRDVFR